MRSRIPWLTALVIIPAVLVAGERAELFEAHKQEMCNLAHLDEEALIIADNVTIGDVARVTLGPAPNETVELLRTSSAVTVPPIRSTSWISA